MCEILEMIQVDTVTVVQLQLRSGDSHQEDALQSGIFIYSTGGNSLAPWPTSLHGTWGLPPEDIYQLCPKGLSSMEPIRSEWELCLYSSLINPAHGLAHGGFLLTLLSE